ncbi:MAG: hypothetical protein H0U39_04445 [Segetibacter sp.]|jgi:hypothetical protein|nr:hypothetical protein [Segetibacter sp.]
MAPTLKRILFVFFKTCFWIGVIGVISYVILSIIFYFIGPDQFMSLQNFVISTGFVYFVPISVLICFFATGYFKAED